MEQEKCSEAGDEQRAERDEPPAAPQAEQLLGQFRCGGPRDAGQG